MLRTALAASAAVLVLGPAAGAAAVVSAGPQDDAKRSVRISDAGFGPLAKVHVGDTVTWVNKGTKPHRAVATGPAAFTSPKLAAGESWSYTFTKAGTYKVVCKLHPAMKAVVVAAAAPAAAKSTPTPAAQEVAMEAAAAEVDTRAGRSAAIMLGSLAAVLFLGLVAKAVPGLGQKD